MRMTYRAVHVDDAAEVMAHGQRGRAKQVGIGVQQILSLSRLLEQFVEVGRY